MFVAEFSPAWERIYANQAYMEFLGRSLHDWLTSPDSMDSIYKPNKEQVAKARKIVDHGRSEVYVLRHHTPSGIKEIRWCNKLVHDDAGKLIKIRCVGRPVVERRGDRRKQGKKGGK